MQKKKIGHKLGCFPRCSTPKPSCTPNQSSWLSSLWTQFHWIPIKVPKFNICPRKIIGLEAPCEISRLFLPPPQAHSPGRLGTKHQWCAPTSAAPGDQRGAAIWGRKWDFTDKIGIQFQYGEDGEAHKHSMRWNWRVEQVTGSQCLKYDLKWKVELYNVSRVMLHGRLQFHNIAYTMQKGRFKFRNAMCTMQNGRLKSHTAVNILSKMQQISCDRKTRFYLHN